MAKDTKDIVIQALLTLASKNNTVSVEQISQYSGITRNTIQKNFNNEGIAGIIKYINQKVNQEIIDELTKYNPDELPVEIYADIVLTIVWKYRRQAHVLYTSDLPFKPHSNTAENTLAFSWVQRRYERLVKEHGLAPDFSANDLLYFWNAYIYSILSMWLSSPIPLNPKQFKPKFLYLIKTSMYDLIYKDIGIH
jgi:hypothetical protein